MRLFRSEAARGQDTLHGDVRLVPPVSWQLLGFFLLASVIAAVAFAALAGYAKVTVVRGSVTGDKGVVRVAPSRDGAYEAVLVSEGQNVVAGQALMRVAIATTDQGGALQLRRAQALVRQSSLLSERLSNVQRGGLDRVAGLEDRISGERQQLVQLQDQAEQQKKLIAAAEDDLEKIQPVARQGLVSNRDLRLREEQVALRKQGLSRLTQETADRQSSIRVAESDIARARAEAAGQVGELAGARAELDRTAAGEDVLSGLVLRAPVTGTVTAIVAHPGDPATPGVAALTLLPKGTRPEATLAVPAAAAGLLDPGQSVRIAVDAFPYQIYGALQSRITSISKTTASLPGNRSEGEAFIVRATLPPVISAYGRPRSLLPGMTLTARIRTRPRSLWAWIFDPVLAVSRR